jgi:protease II
MDFLVSLGILNSHILACLTHGRLANDGTKLYIRTNEDAPQYKVVTLDLADETRERKVIIPEDKDAHLEDAVPVSDNTFVVVYKRNVSLLYMFLPSC